MSVIKFDRDFNTLFNWDTDDNPTTEQDYQNAVKNWTETEMNIVDTLLWQPTTEYATGNIVKTPSLPSQYVLRCAEAGTSGSTEPSYSGASVGDTVTDGSVEWVIVSLATGNAADADASNVGINAEVDNSEAWASAIGGGAIAEDDGKLVKGGTVYAVTSVMESNIATNTEAIGDNAEAIATNTANIESSAVKIDIDDKRISNIEKLLQGNLYDYQTDSTSAYTKTVPSGAMPYASLDSIGGKTVVWNQLCGATTFPVTHGEHGGTVAWNGDAVVYSGTLTSVSWLYVRVASGNTIPADNHKYLAMTDNIPSGYRFGILKIGGDFAYTGDNIPYYLFTNTNGITAINYRIPADTTVNFTAHLMLFDLTLMFGAGNEPSTVEEFQQQFPAPYYAFNQGSLLSAGVTEVKSVGRNLWNLENRTLGDAGISTNTTPRTWDESKFYYEFTRNNYYYKNEGTFTPITNGFEFTANGNYRGVLVPFKVNAGEKYTLTCNFDVSSFNVGYSYYDKDGNFLSFDTPANTETLPKYKATCTIPANAIWLAVVLIGNANVKFTVNNIQLEKGTTATDYVPYRQPISYPIPASVQALEGYGWSAGNVREGEAYNYIDYERKVFVQNVGKVTVTSADVPAADSGYISSGVFTSGDYVGHAYTSIRNFKYSTGGTFATLDRNVGYPAVTQFCHEIHINDKSLISIQYRTYFIDIADRDTLLAKIGAGVDMYYELQTPIEVDISAYITDDNLISVESGGTLTFPNSNGDDYRIPVPSAETYMIDLQSAL